MNTHPSSARTLFRDALVDRSHLFVQAAAAALLANSLSLFAALYSMQVYDRVIPTQGLSTLTVLTVGVLIAAVLELVVKVARAYILESAVKGMDIELSHAIFRRLLRLRMDQFPATVGTLAAQLRSYETIRGFTSSATLYLLVDAPFALLFLAVIALLAGVSLAAIPAVFLVIAVAIGLFYKARIARHAKSSSAASNKKLGLLVEAVESAENIKAAGAAPAQMAHWNNLCRQTIDDDIDIRRYSEQATYWAGFIQQVSYVCIVAMGAWVAASTTNLTTGGLIACSILSGRVLGPVAALPGLIVQWAHARAALEGLEKVFALQCDNHGIAKALNPQSVHGGYRLQQVEFAYPGPIPRRAAALRVDQLQLAPGSKVALLGTIGAGKSTLLKILAGLYAAQRGQVLLDGLDIQQIERARLSKAIGYLSQDPKLLSGTLRDNLTSGLDDRPSDDDILAACKSSGLIGLVATHPQGLDLPIFEGGRGVSGGQKQLIALTRVLLVRPCVWLLDEPTSAMDEHSEHQALEALRAAMHPQHTMILVAHKPVLLDIVDRIVVLTPEGVAMDGPRDLMIERLRRSAAPPRAFRPAAMEVVA
ncbi:ATP-binding cassette domain-containing protein [Rhodoferax sp.]|jgi:ATP-binding cassette subfamily C protein LapB|uniref:ATP-binding cassette domain-containing protein n=1 Tax=Rhodoferax sp. TaxID=50421 RepID=UPI003784D9D1